MYDVNPDIYGNALSLGVSENDNSISFELALETSGYYDIGVHDAKDTVANIRTTVTANWQALAAGYGLSKGAVERMSPAFAMEHK